ncbi:MAG: glycosyl transferase [Deltaproteobacteria bacterium RIFCSPHIGHO2_12_FULL_43_9]|nr:MAG: glycosyl transferase [Deltaproteobacteria bacterium RIFCSPHIGHO2_12_FULL_43_9]
MISVVIPIYNEKDSIEPLFSELLPVMNALEVPYEVICVDDGSSDGSSDLLKNFSKSDAKIKHIKFKTNCGQTAAFDAGFRAAKGGIIITLDADLQNDPNDIPKVIEALEHADVACGWRWKRNDPVIKKISSKIANGVRNWLNQEDIKDTGCSLKAFRRSVVERFKLYKGLHRFFPTLAKMEGFRVVEVKVNHRERQFGISKYGVTNRIFRALADAFAIRWMQKRIIRYEFEENIS